ncbi:MAG: hypothetical protein ACXWQZ_01305, partial [Ktedonobacterales bacterium]
LDTEKANLASPTFTGDPKAPTAAPGDADTSIATTAFVDTSFVKTPATNTANNVPQWNGANSKTLKDGLGVGTGPNNLVQLDGSSKLPAVDGSQLTGISAGIPAGYIYNLTLANNGGAPTTTIDIAAGSAINDINTTLMTLVSGLTKQLSVAWAVGTNQGMLATGAAVADGTYHIFLIRRPDTGVVDIAADTSVSGANISSNTNVNYSQKRRIGSIIRSGGAILGFTQKGNEFLWNVPVSDVAAGTAGNTSGTLITLTVPVGIKVNAKIGAQVAFSAGNYLLFTSPDQANTAASATAYTASVGAASTPVSVFGDFRTNASAQIRQRTDNVSVTYGVITNGWIDNRDATVISSSSTITAIIVPNYLTGLVLSNNVGTPASSLDVAAGTAADTTNSQLMTLASSITKSLASNFVAGTGNGGLDTGTVADGTYHVFLIANGTASLVDVLFSTSPTSPTMPTGYTLKRRIGSIIRSGGTILAFSQFGNDFLLATQVANIAAVAPAGTTAVLQAVTVPTGIKVDALLRVRQDDSGGAVATFYSSPDETDQAAGSGVASISTTTTATTAAEHIRVRTNTSSQVRIRSSATTCTRTLSTYGWTDNRDNFSMAGGVTYDGNFSQPQGRLTLQSLTPVMTTTQSAKTTLIYTAYHGNLVPLYNGSIFTMRSIGTEISVATTDATKNPAAIGASKVNDWFVWDDAGVIRLSHGPDWTSDTVRSAGTALVMVNGILLNNASITNGPAASRGTYVGTTRSNGSSQLDWIYGGIGAGGTAAFFGIWNAYNRVSVGAFIGDSNDSWTYTAQTWRPSDNSTSMRASFVVGLQEDFFSAEFNAMAFNSAGVNVRSAVGYNSTSAISGTMAIGSESVTLSLFSKYTTQPSVGFNFFQALEWSTAAGVTTWSGDNGTPADIQNGLIFLGRM